MVNWCEFWACSIRTYFFPFLVEQSHSKNRRVSAFFVAAAASLTSATQDSSKEDLMGGTVHFLRTHYTAIRIWRFVPSVVLELQSLGWNGITHTYSKWRNDSKRTLKETTWLPQRKRCFLPCNLYRSGCVQQTLLMSFQQEKSYIWTVVLMIYC